MPLTGTIFLFHEVGVYCVIGTSNIERVRYREVVLSLEVKMYHSIGWCIRKRGVLYSERTLKEVSLTIAAIKEAQEKTVELSAGFPFSTTPSALPHIFQLTYFSLCVRQSSARRLSVSRMLILTYFSLCVCQPPGHRLSVTMMLCQHCRSTCWAYNAYSIPPVTSI